MADYDMEAAVRAFFSSPRFAVAGASSDPNKFGHKSMLPCSALLTNVTVIQFVDQV